MKTIKVKASTRNGKVVKAHTRKIGGGTGAGSGKEFESKLHKPSFDKRLDDLMTSLDSTIWHKSFFESTKTLKDKVAGFTPAQLKKVAHMAKQWHKNSSQKHQAAQWLKVHKRVSAMAEKSAK